MEWKDIAGAIGTAAPILGTVIAGPAGGAVGGAVSAVIKAFGLSGDATPEQVNQAIKQDPDAALKLMVAENEFKLRQRDQDIAELRVLIEDTQSARTRQTDSEKTTGSRDVNLYVLAWTIVGGFFILLGLLMKFAVPADQNGVIFMLFGSLSTGFGQVLQYFFGSSKGSADKTTFMAKSGKELGK
jgi:hypothetical protein